MGFRQYLSRRHYVSRTGKQVPKLLRRQFKLLPNRLPKPSHLLRPFADLSDLAQNIGSGLGTISIFINGWASVDYGNSVYGPHFDKLGQLFVDYTAPMNQFKKLLLSLDDSEFEAILTTDRLLPIKFYLTELRTDAKRLLDDQTEALINQFDLDGQQAWSQHYDTISAGLSLTYTDAEDGQKRQISAGQALNMLDGEANNETRANIMANYEKMWASAENLTADTLNHLAGFRLTNQKAHGRQSHLEQPLEMNRMSQATLDTMWAVVDANKAMFKPYFERKKQLLGLEKLGWQDQVAPLTQIGDYQPTEVSYDDAAAFIIEQFGKFSPKMAEFARWLLRSAGSNQKIAPVNNPAVTWNPFLTYMNHVFSSLIPVLSTMRQPLPTN